MLHALLLLCLFTLVTSTSGHMAGGGGGGGAMSGGVPGSKSDSIGNSDNTVDATNPGDGNKPVLFSETAHVLVLQFHFMHNSNTLSSLIDQIEQLDHLLAPNIDLPNAIAWRIAAPNFRSNTTVKSKFPSLEENVHSIRLLNQIYSKRNQTLKIIYYPDLGIGYTDEWAITAKQHHQVQHDPTIAVHTLMPNDLTRWNNALRHAAKQDGGRIILFEELVFEAYGAPIKPPNALSPTVISLRANPLLKTVAVSLTPDFSVMGGKCKSNVKDSCSTVIRNPNFPKSTYYTQAYNIYTTQTPTSGPTLTDLTPWSENSPSASCIKSKTEKDCNMKSKCCSWL